MDQGEVTMTHVRVHDYPGKVIILELEVAAPNTVEAQVESARSALRGLFTFCTGVCEPLTADVHVNCRDRETDYPQSSSTLQRPFWFIRSKGIPTGVYIESAWENAEAVETEQLIAESVLDVVKVALEQGCGDNDIAGWNEILMRATAARLPFAADDALTVASGSNETTVPVDRRSDSSWVSGPRWPAIDKAPIELRLTKEIGLITLEVRILWSIWADSGETDVDRAVASLLDIGWSPANDSDES